MKSNRTCIIARRRLAGWSRRQEQVSAAVIVLLLLGWWPVFSAAQPPSKRKPSEKTPRAPRPDWRPGDATDIFFDDAFQTLSGERPDHLKPDRGRETQSQLADPSARTARAVAAKGWSARVDAETLESQVKLQIQSLQTSVKSPARFASGNFRTAQQQFGYLATLFQVISEYSGEVRWKQTARVASQACAATAAICDQGTAPSFAAAKRTRDQLLDLLNGNSMPASDSPVTDSPVTDSPVTDSPVDWEQTASRSGWMKWIEAAEERVKQGTSSAANLKQAKARLITDAQMLRLISEVLIQDGMEDGDDEDYQALSAALQAAADQLITAVAQDRHEQAAEAAAQINQSCINCHEMYKG